MCVRGQAISRPDALDEDWSLCTVVSSCLCASMTCNSHRTRTKCSDCIHALLRAHLTHAYSHTPHAQHTNTRADHAPRDTTHPTHITIARAGTSPTTSPSPLRPAQRAPRRREGARPPALRQLQLQCRPRRKVCALKASCVCTCARTSMRAHVHTHLDGVGRAGGGAKLRAKSSAAERRPQLSKV